MPEQWPTYFPLPTLTGVSQVRQNALQDRTAEVGPPRSRRMSSAVAVSVPMRLIADTGQTWAIERFHRETLAEGAKPFWMPDPMQSGKPLADHEGVVLTTEEDIPLLLFRQNLCQFQTPPTFARLNADHNRVSFAVWYLPT